MKKINIRRTHYLIRHKYLTLNNVVFVVALAIAVGFVWGSLGVMQRNYALQKEVDSKKRQLQMAELETSSLELEKRYYQTREYQELAVREDMGLVTPGEKVLVLPANTQAAKNANNSEVAKSATKSEPESNFRQWINFLFGGNSKSLSS